MHEKVDRKGVASGYPGLDTSGLIPTSQLGTGAAGPTVFLNGNREWVAAGGGGTPATTVVTETTYGQASAVGISTNYAREDHTHGTPTAVTAGLSQAQVLARGLGC
jgi:hypothetical protein